MSLAVVDEPCFFVFRERLPAPRLIGRQHYLFHGGGEVEVLRRHVEDAVEHERQLLRFAVLVFAHDAEEVVLKVRARDVGERFAAEHGLQVHTEGAFVFLEGGGLCCPFFNFQPFAGVVRKEDGLGGAFLFGGLFGRGGCRIAGGEPVQKAAAHGLKVSAGRLNVHTLAADARLKVAVRGDAVVDDVVVCNENLSDMFGHGSF